MKSSVSKRTLKLLSLATKVGRKELKQSLKNQIFKKTDDATSGRIKTRVEQAQLIVEHLSQLKGAAMKVGQLLSLDGGEIFPPEAVEILSRLQGQIQSTPWEVIKQVLVEELGDARLKDFTFISESPAASASIGQVHKGELFGRKVAIKIQYPEVAASIDSDLKILRKLAQGLLSVTGRQMDLTDVFAELATVLKQEANYNQERENLKEFGLLFKGSEKFCVPGPVDTHSTEKVLTMAWLDGLTLTEWLKSLPLRSAREKIGRLVLDLFCKEFFEFGFVQTDPNFANFLIDPEKLTLGLLDFGAALKYSKEFRLSYVELLRTVDTQDQERILQNFTDFGFLDPRESDEARGYLVELIKLSVEPFRPENQPFSFQDKDFQSRTQLLVQQLSKALKFSTPPRKILFLHRKLGGVFAMLKKLDAEINLEPYWQRMTQI